jgi:hypothetical protein
MKGRGAGCARMCGRRPPGVLATSRSFKPQALPRRRRTARARSSPSDAAARLRGAGAAACFSVSTDRPSASPIGQVTDAATNGVLANCPQSMKQLVLKLPHRGGKRKGAGRKRKAPRPRGMQGLAVRIAKALNRVMQRRGALFDDHYHSRLLRSPTELVNAIAYVLGNHEHHYGPSRGVDRYSSLACARERVLAVPTTWLIRVGWRRANARSPWMERWLAFRRPVDAGVTMAAA